jgi:RimJ/RimL family protein N-acetyltransferase
VGSSETRPPRGLSPPAPPDRLTSFGGHPPHPNSGLPEFGTYKRPKSDISDLGWGGISGCVEALHLPGAGKVTLREALPHDTGIIQNYVRGLAADARHNRFLGAVNELSASELHAMTHSDHGRYPALIAETVVNDTRTMIGEARYALTADGRGWEFAISVAEPWRCRALGTLLISIVGSRAKALGLRYLVGDVLSSNRAMMALARKLGFAVTAPIGDARLARITKDLATAHLSCAEIIASPMRMNRSPSPSRPMLCAVTRAPSSSRNSSSASISG